MENFVRGDPVLIEVTINKRIPFGVLELNDPENGVTISIEDEDRNVVVNSVHMVTEDVGQYYYIYQTTSSNLLGIYKSTIFVDGAVYDANYITNRIFKVVATSDEVHE